MCTSAADCHLEVTVNQYLRLLSYIPRGLLPVELSTLLLPEGEDYEVPPAIMRRFPQVTSVQALKLKLLDPNFIYGSLKFCPDCYAQAKPYLDGAKVAELEKDEVEEEDSMPSPEKEQVKTSHVMFSKVKNGQEQVVVQPQPQMKELKEPKENDYQSSPENKPQSVASDKFNRPRSQYSNKSRGRSS